MENKMKVQVCLAIVLAFLIATFGLGQSDTPGHEVSIGYSFLHDNRNDRNGFVASFSERMKNRLWIKAEVSGNYKHELFLATRQVDFVHAVLAGPEFKFRAADAKLIPWAHFLIGMTINNRPELELGTPFLIFRRNSDIGFGFQPGGGVDYFFSQRFGIRLGADYRHASSRFNGNDFLRLHGGMLVRF